MVVKEPMLAPMVAKLKMMIMQAFHLHYLFI